jgi:hypothetical protein
VSDADELHATLVALLDALAASDPRRRRFGAAAHGWQRRPALGQARVDELEAADGVRLPADYRDYLVRVADGGAGPYHGVLPYDHPAQRALARGGPCPLVVGRPVAAGDPDPWRGVVALADLGCDQSALLVVDGPAHGTVWADARAVGAGVVPLAASFTDFFGGGLAGAARGELPPAFAPPSACPIPGLLSGLLAREEERLGRPAGTLSGEELRTALGQLGLGSIAIGSIGTPLHARGEVIAPCIQCSILVDNLGAQGLAPGVLARPTAPFCQTG